MIFDNVSPLTLKALRTLNPARNNQNQTYMPTEKAFCFESKYSIATKDITCTQFFCLML